MTAKEIYYMAQVKRFEWTTALRQRPNLDVVKCNVDGSFNRSLARMGNGCCIRKVMVHLSRQLQVGPARFWKFMKGKPMDFGKQWSGHK
ncbi:hypothetical protein A2U01_0055478, partial [Trifolium medium]|nr:hypothetical protein [Trifolium medium]